MSTWPIQFSLEDVRCFEGAHQGQLRPITLLIGENSTGKSSFLGCYTVIHKLFEFPMFYDFDADFNQDPFQMGSFREIVRARFGPAGRINEFKLGLGLESELSKNKKRVFVSFVEHGSQPVVAALRYELGNLFLELRQSNENKIEILAPVGTTSIRSQLSRALSVFDFLHPERSRTDLDKRIQDYIDKFSAKWLDSNRRRRRFDGLINSGLTSVAPLRARRKRTYDPVRETASPEGEHVPMVMMRLSRSEKNKWQVLHDELVTFGSESGMFSDIKVKGHGRQMSDPFQLQVKVRSGAHANIMDVGYGVSQSLPILVDIMGAQHRTFILQQPEVHLHPRGQAELASFFVESTRKRHNRFFIETHSDYIVDRVRINVRQGRLPAADVSILYFEPHGNSVRLHNISLDEYGNLSNVPNGYREFFGRETDRLLGFED